jgi:hypothetical protein
MQREGLVKTVLQDGHHNMAVNVRKGYLSMYLASLRGHAELSICTTVPETFQNQISLKIFYNHFNQRFKATSARLTESGIREFRYKSFQNLLDLQQFLTNNGNGAENFKADISESGTTNWAHLDFSIRFQAFLYLFLGGGLGICLIVFFVELDAAAQARGDLLRMWLKLRWLLSQFISTASAWFIK